MLYYACPVSSVQCARHRQLMLHKQVSPVRSASREAWTVKSLQFWQQIFWAWLTTNLVEFCIYQSPQFSLAPPSDIYEESVESLVREYTCYQIYTPDPNWFRHNFPCIPWNPFLRYKVIAWFERDWTFNTCQKYGSLIFEFHFMVYKFFWFFCGSTTSDLSLMTKPRSIQYEIT